MISDFLDVQFHHVFFYLGCGSLSCQCHTLHEDLQTRREQECVARFDATAGQILCVDFARAHMQLLGRMSFLVMNAQSDRMQLDAVIERYLPRHCFVYDLD